MARENFVQVGGRELLPMIEPKGLAPEFRSVEASQKILSDLRGVLVRLDERLGGSASQLGVRVGNDNDSGGGSVRVGHEGTFPSLGRRFSVGSAIY